MTVVGLEAPLIDGIVDQWPTGSDLGAKFLCCSPEGSKSRKQMMDKRGIPTAPWAYFDSRCSEGLVDCQKENDWVVTKPDGLTGGKE